MASGLAGAFVGEVRMWAGGGSDSSNPITLNGDPGSAPIEAQTGWLVCNGAVISNTQYPDLVTELGTSHNLPGDSLPAGSVRLPNLQQKHPIGRHVSGTYAILGSRGGDPVHTHNMSGHTHSMDHTHDMASHTHGMSHFHSHDHTHDIQHSHPLNIGSGGPSAPYVQAADAAGGPGWTVTQASHIHIVTGSTGGVQGGYGSPFSTSSGPASVLNTATSSTTNTVGPSVSNTGGPSTSVTGGPNTAPTGTQSTPAPYVVLHFLIKT